MSRTRIFNFHDARLSVAQSAIRENVAQLAPGAPAFGLFANNPIMQAAGAVLDRIYRGEVRTADAAIAAYRVRRAVQTAEGMLVAGALDVGADCLDLLTRYVIAWVFDDREEMARIANEWEFSPCNVTGGLKILQEWLDYYWRGRKPQYNPPTADGPGAFPLPPSASAGAPLRVGVLGDWGTGQLEARAVLDQLMRQAPDLIVHVGDVYYSGTVIEQNGVVAMLREARAACGRDIPFYTMPGNHDYYSGGVGFYRTLPLLNQDVPNASVQQHSFWCLRNDAWQLQGMDTGYYDSDLLKIDEDITHLREDEAAWHQRQLMNAGGRKVILFSHHQLFSAFEKIGGMWANPFLEKNLADWEAASGIRPAAWLWGHEHVLGIYQVPGSLPVLGRCVGNGAIPVFTDTQAYTPQPGGAPMQPAEHSPDGSIHFPHGYVQTQPEDLVWSSGFAMLELASDGTATASYWQVRFEGVVGTATSQLLWQEPVPASS
ncbi:MAG TPA: metallophosphoesterase [Longimicrobium sp.]|nr:metallophosphoesterase [Longimicrobium sp.]